MTRPAKITTEQLLALLGGTGPRAGGELPGMLGISQATLSRLLRRCPEALLVMGRARSTRYAARRSIRGLGAGAIPVFELRPLGQEPRLLLRLNPVAPRGFAVESVLDGRWSEFEDLPWFLDILRPSGFLGRLDTLHHEALGNPRDVRDWSGDDVLRLISVHGWNLPGAFVVGHGAMERFLALAVAPPDLVEATQRPRRYPELAARALEHGQPGSSAAGEQPKFLATVKAGGNLTPVLVKFSPPVNDPRGRRVADLLVAEHLGHGIMAQQGIPAAESQMLEAGGRVFLEVQRFDRQGPAHRLGQVSLGALDGGMLGTEQASWSASVGWLVQQGLASEADLQRVHWLETFGRCLGNTDMHFGNLAFLLDGTQPRGLAPVYDMLPMHYFPRHQELSTSPFPLPADKAAQALQVPDAVKAAAELWQAVASDSRVSRGFQRIAREAQKRVMVLGRGLQ